MYSHCALATGVEIELFTTTSTGSTNNLDLTGKAFAQTITGNVDRIMDYNVADDTISLEDAIFTAIAQASGTMLSDYFKANTAGVATDANDRIVYDTDDGLLYYDSDGNGAGAAIQFATLTAGLALTFNDFDVV